MDKVYVGKLGKAVGLKGHVKLFIESDFPEQFQAGGQFVTNKNTTLVIEEYNANRDMVKFENINDMDSAKKLTNTLLYSTYEQTRQTCTLKENQYFWFDIIDCQIIENGEILGCVKDIHRYPLGDYLEIKTADALVDKSMPKIFLLPYLDDYVLNVDIEKKELLTQGAFDILSNS